MTPVERALWVAAQEDYTNALKIAHMAVKAQMPEASPEVVQAGAATVLIHLQRMRDNNWKQDHQPRAATQTLVVTPIGVVPPCPKCGGTMKVNADRKSDSLPKYVCLQQNGTCVTESKKKPGQFYPTGAWDKQPQPSNASYVAPPVNQVPPALAQDDDDLPF